MSGDHSLSVANLTRNQVILLFGVLAVLALLAFAFEFLLVDKGPGRCDKMLLGGAFKDNCYYSVAVETKDILYCSKITEIVKHDNCLAEVSVMGGTTAFSCYSLSTDSNRDNCLAQQALLSRNPAPCLNTSSDSIKDACINAVALNTTNVSLCGMLINDNSKISCANEVNQRLAVSKSDISYCSKLEANNTAIINLYHDQCIQKVVSASGDTSLCAHIISQQLKTTCMGTTVSEETCVTESNPDVQSACYLGLAVSKNDSSYCKMVISGTLKDNCYYQLAVGQFNSSLCDNIATENLRANCLIATGKS